MESLEERDWQQLRELEANRDAHSVTRQQFRTVSRRWRYMG